MGERLNGIQEVGGSIPPGSTKKILGFFLKFKLSDKNFWLIHVFNGFILTLPILLVYVAMGLSFGFLAIDNGISPLNAILMSLLIYAGTVQLVGIQLIAIEASIFSILLTTFIINSRFFVMSSSIGRFLNKFKLYQRFLYACQLTDATFAIHTVRFSQFNPPKLELFTTNIFGHVVWVISTTVGVYLGGRDYNFDSLGIDFAMPAMFIGLLLPLVLTKIHLLICVIAGTLTVILYLIGFSYWTTLTSTVITILIGLYIFKWNKT